MINFLASRYANRFRLDGFSTFDNKMRKHPIPIQC